jgi:hypothetical protein
MVKWLRFLISSLAHLSFIAMLKCTYARRFNNFQIIPVALSRKWRRLTIGFGLFFVPRVGAELLHRVQ